MNKINNLIKLLNKLGHSGKAEKILKMSEELGESIVDEDEFGESLVEENELGESLTNSAIISELKKIKFPSKGNYKGLSWEVKRLRNKSATYTFIFNWSGSGIDEGNLKPLFYKGGNYNKLKLEMFAHRGEGDAPVYTKLLDILHSDEVDYSQVSDSMGEYKEYTGDLSDLMDIKHGNPTVKPKEDWSNPDEPEYITSWSQDVKAGKIENKTIESKIRLLSEAVVYAMNEYIEEILIAYNYIEKDLKSLNDQIRFSLASDEIPYSLRMALEEKMFDSLKDLGKVTQSNLAKTLMKYNPIWKSTKMLRSGEDIELQRAFENSIIL